MVIAERNLGADRTLLDIAFKNAQASTDATVVLREERKITGRHRMQMMRR